MTISIVTITRGDGPLLKRAVESVYAQSLPDDVVLEHIVVDGNTEPGDPGVLAAEALGSKVLRVPPRGCYNAMNEGLDVASGQIVGLLHGTDFYAGTKVLSQVVETFRKSNCDFVYGDVAFVRSRSSGISCGRYYTAANFRPAHIRFGFAPPHPSLFVSKQTMLLMQGYKTDYRNAADFEYFVRLFLGKHHLKAVYIKALLVYMEAGGASSTLFSRLVTNTREKRRALRENGFSISWTKLFMRYFFHSKLVRSWKRK